MILEQYYLGCLSQASYLIGDESTGTAVVVDPRRDVDEYIRAAHERGLTIRHVFLTHFHADFVAGHLELAQKTGASIHLGAGANAEYPHVAHADGDSLSLGNVRLGILATPGHTPEGISITVHDGDSPAYAVLTGDTLFIGDVGRPDLMASIGITAEELAGQLYDSLHDKLMTLPDATLVYPGHGAGSMCGKNLSTDTVSTIGAQRAMNYALQPMSKAEFIGVVAAEQPAAPRYFAHDAMLNRQQRSTFEDVLREGMRPLQLEEVVRVVNGGGQLLDVREEDAFAAGHLVGAINVGLSGKFATWAGSVLDVTKPVVVIADPGREGEASTRLARIGLDRVVGYLADGMAALGTRPELLATTRRLPVAELHDVLTAEREAAVLDVRTPGEWAAGHIEGSVNLPLLELSERLTEVPAGRPLFVVCRSGYRSSCAASVLERAGIDGVGNVVGGMLAWQDFGLHVAT